MTPLISSLIVGAIGYAVRHYEVLSTLGALVGVGPKAPAVPTTSAPVLTDAATAAVKQVATDAAAGHVASLKDELAAVVKSAVAAVVADLQKPNTVIAGPTTAPKS